MLQKLEKIQQDLQDVIEECRIGTREELEILLGPWCSIEDNENLSAKQDKDPIG